MIKISPTQNERILIKDNKYFPNINWFNICNANSQKDPDGSLEAAL